MYQPQDPRQIEGGSEQDEILIPHPEPARWGWKRAAAGAAASVALMLAGAAIADYRRPSGLSSAEGAELSCFRTQCSKNAGGNQRHYYDLYYDLICGHQKGHYNQNHYEYHYRVVVITIIIIIR